VERIFTHYLSERSDIDLQHFRVDVNYDHCSRWALECGIDGHSWVHDNQDSDCDSDGFDGPTADDPYPVFSIPQRMVTLSSSLLKAFEVSPVKLDFARRASNSLRTSSTMLSVADKIINTDKLRGDLLKVPTR
jgi:hypothetical protein